MPYDLGGPVDYLLDIHFPDGRGRGKEISLPWFYYLTNQLPTYFQYLGTSYWGHGWQCTPNLPVIKILPIDTQPYPNPTKPVGFSSIEEAIRRTNAGQPISQDAWGRFDFKSPLFWKIMGTKKPRFTEKKGLISNQPSITGDPPIGTIITNLTHGWETFWNAGANAFNSATLTVAGEGDYGVVPPYNGGFALVGPPPGATIPQLQQHLYKEWYFGAIPPTEVFETGQALITKQSFAFTFAVAQLDDHVWDMSVFPPQDASLAFSGRVPSAVSGNYNGYNPNPNAAPFPLISPVIV